MFTALMDGNKTGTQNKTVGNTTEQSNQGHNTTKLLAIQQNRTIRDTAKLNSYRYNNIEPSEIQHNQAVSY